MSLKGIAIWILGFFSFLSAANVINAVFMWFNTGPASTFTPYLLGGVTGPIPVYAYFVISVLATLVFFAVTADRVVNELSVGDQIGVINEKANRLQAGQESQRTVLEGVQAKVFLLDESLENARQEFSRQILEQGDAIKKNAETGHQAQQKILNGVEGRVFLLDESMKGVKKGLNEQAEAIKGVNTNLVERVSPQISDVKADLAQVEQRDKKTEAANAKQRDEIKEIRLKLERLEATLGTPKTLLTSQSNVEDVKGIGPGKGAELKEIGITNAGDLIMADPKAVAEKTGASENTVGKWQGRAQLSLIPGMKDKDLTLLEELDITDRKSLATQDPIELGKRINAIFKVNLARGKVSEADKPTIEEIDSWVKFVKS